MSNIKISLYDELKSNIADNNESGDQIFKLIEDAINGNNTLTIDFKGIELLNTAFLNNAIGKIYSLPKEKVDASHIRIENFPSNVVELLKEVVITAKQKYEK